MRFPLIVMVLFIHVLPERYEHVTLPVSFDSLYFFVSELLSHNIGRIAVPMFFFISGYLFFYGGRDSGSLSFYTDKWRRRVKTLVLPYLLWNIILCVAIFVKDALFFKLGLGHDEGAEMIKIIGPYGVIWGMPLNFPLWYLRDLICMTLLTPLFHIVFKVLNYWGVVILVVPYLLGYESQIAGFSSTAIVFFGTGCYFGMKRVDLVPFVRKFGPSIFFISVVFLIVGVFLNDSVYHETVMRLYIPLGLLSFSYVMNSLFATKLFNRFISLSGTVFFIYAVHEVYILNWSKGLFVRLFGEGVMGMWLKYLLVPVLVLVVSMCVYRVLYRIMPRTLAILCGNRTR